MLLSLHKDGCDLIKQLYFGAGDGISSFRFGDIGTCRLGLAAQGPALAVRWVLSQHPSKSVETLPSTSETD